MFRFYLERARQKLPRAALLVGGVVAAQWVPDGCAAALLTLDFVAKI
jgi:hypothetical protein